MKHENPPPATGKAGEERDGASKSILGFADRLRDARKEEPEKQKTYESWVAFRVSSRNLALPVTHVREILRLRELTGVPNAPAPVAGVMNLRGHVLPVVDTHAMLGLPSALATEESRVLICVLDHRSIGLIVDQVAGLERIQMETVRTAADDDPLSARSNGLIARGDDEPLLLLEPDRLFAGNTAALN